MLKTEQYYELDEEIIDFFKEIEKEFAFAMDVKYTFQSNNKLKNLIEIKKIPDNVAVLLKSELLVTVNEDFYDKLDEEINKILFEQELDKIHMNLEKGTIKLKQLGLKTSTGLVRKFTYEKVERAYESLKTLLETKKTDE